MNTKDDQGAIRTPPRIIVYAGVIGLFVAFLTGYVAWNNTLWEMGPRVALKWGLISGVTAGSLGIALVGLCGLLAGAKLGRNFSYPFTLSLGVFGSLMLIALTSYSYPDETQEGLIWFMGIVLAVIAGAVLTMCIDGYRRWSRAGATVGAAVGTAAMLLIVECMMRMGLIWFMGIVLAVIAGVVLAMCIRGSRRWSRAGAAVGTVAMLLIGGYLMRIAVGRTVSGREAWAFLIVTLSFAVCGGVLGAVVGAICGGVARCWTRKGAAIGAVAMLLIGGCLMHIAVGRTLSDREAWAFLIVTLSFAVCGGSLGAVAGAISGGVARCWTRKGVTSSQ